MTESTSALRCLVCGDVKGEFSTLFKRVGSLLKKGGNFDLLLCVGDFFGSKEEEWEEYLEGKKKVPISTLILGPNSESQVKFYEEKDGQEICPNVTFLGKYGRYRGSSGLQIAYLSGVAATGSVSSAGQYHFTEEDVWSLTAPVQGDNRYKGVDILLTSQWPQGVDRYGISLTKEPTNVSPLVGEVARQLRPRYHFAGLNHVFYERQPYRNHQMAVESARPVTRFVGLAAVGNPNKDKFLYAFTITPLSQLTSDELCKQPPDSTESPYKPVQISSSKAPAEDESQYFYDMKAANEKAGSKRSHNNEDGQNKKRKPAQPTGPCWFCLGSPEVEKHLVCSVGTDTYLALAKGGLVDDHVLILPIGHYQSYVSAPTEVQEEIDAYKDCLKKFFRSKGHGVLFYERNYRTQHLQIQVIPVPQDVVHEVKDAFLESAESSSMELHEIPKHSDLSQIVPVGVPYFYAELPCGGKLLHRISKNFPLQFAREVMAEPVLLNIPEKIDWRNCSAGKERETELAADFKQAFKKFDFNLN